MTRLLAALLLCPALLAACAPVGPQVPAGAYQIRPNDVPEIQYRMLDSVNALRAEAGVAPVALDARLTAAAQAHATDMSRQRRDWPFGADGTSPYDRVQRAGYGGALVAELYAQTFETELDTLAAWVDDGAWGAEILDPAATDMGFAWQQDPSGLLWWVIVMGERASPNAVPGTDAPVL
jgi:uncharacterized protein YkwD